MPFRLLSYPNKSILKPSFFIQIKGDHSGRPLKNSIPNCCAVYSEIPNLYEIVFLLYKGKEFHPHIIGSVVPFIRLENLQSVINKGLNVHHPKAAQLLQQTKAIEDLINVSNEKIKLLRSMQVAICKEFLQ